MRRNLAVVVLSLVLVAVPACRSNGPARATEGALLLRASAASAARKARSEATLRAMGVPVLESLPAIEDADEVTLREPEAVARRVLALVLVSAKALGPLDFFDKVRPAYQPLAALSPAEQLFVAQASPGEADLLAFKWRVEALWALAWALRGVDELGSPTRMADTRAIVEMIGETPEKFVRYARLRPVDELLDAADLTYRTHWATRDAWFNDRPMPGDVLQGVVKERHHALNWLIGYPADTAWDQVTTDT